MSKELPQHLKKYIVDQNYDRYSAIDQAVWRFIMRQLKHFLTQNAHPCYIDGLEKTGITTDKIPHISEMSKKLNKYGWQAIPVSGFIPPAAFMELQSLGYLPIASDMRTLEHLGYTPAPDIVHEAAGHAPILIDPQFSAYLKSYASLASKSILNIEDIKLYKAIRDLSDIKEHPDSTPEMIKECEEQLEKATKNAKDPSEAALLARMNWWTAEYGLIGTVDKPQIYGAGLLSSVQESRSSLTKNTKKIPFDINCIDYSYDITEPQPQLFVVEKFSDLTRVLEEMSERMSFKRGGIYGLSVARRAKTVNTIEYNSGLQVSGVLSDFIEKEGKPAYIQMTGPTQLSFDNSQLEGHDKSRHPEGFGAPVGTVKSKDLSTLNPAELISLGIKEERQIDLQFDSGVLVSGTIKTILTSNNKTLLITFTNCKVTYEQKTLFDPTWGEYDMAVGSDIVSVFGGPADRNSYGEIEDFSSQLVPPKIFSPTFDEHESLYAKVRLIRENFEDFDNPEDDLIDILQEVKKKYSSDWLLQLELLEVMKKHSLDLKLQKKVEQNLSQISEKTPLYCESIQDGLKISHIDV